MCMERRQPAVKLAETARSRRSPRSEDPSRPIFLPSDACRVAKSREDGITPGRSTAPARRVHAVSKNPWGMEPAWHAPSSTVYHGLLAVCPSSTESADQPTPPHRTAHPADSVVGAAGGRTLASPPPTLGQLSRQKRSRNSWNRRLSADLLACACAHLSSCPVISGVAGSLRKSIGVPGVVGALVGAMAMCKRVTKQQPRMWGPSIVGYLRS